MNIVPIPVRRRPFLVRLRNQYRLYRKPPFSFGKWKALIEAWRIAA